MTTEVVARQTQPVVRMDPQALLAAAVDKGAGVDTLERLVALAKDVRAEQARSAWYEAMSEFQRRCPTINKTSKANIPTSKGFYSYKYAPLDEIMATIRPLLGDLGLSVFWSSPPQAPAGYVVTSCRVAHVLGHVEESGQVSLPIPDSQDRSGGNPLQRIGSALSYARRYSLMSIMGISPEDDDDAQSAAAPKMPSKPEPPPAPVKTPALQEAMEKAWVKIGELTEALGWTNTQLRDHCAAEFKVKSRAEMNADQLAHLAEYLANVLAKREQQGEATGR